MSQEDVCSICLDPPTVIASLDSCAHIYCYACIHQWSTYANTCPRCRERFHAITKKEPDDKNQGKKRRRDKGDLQSAKKNNKKSKRDRVTVVPHRDQGPQINGLVSRLAQIGRQQQQQQQQQQVPIRIDMIDAATLERIRTQHAIPQVANPVNPILYPEVNGVIDLTMNEVPLQRPPRIPSNERVLIQIDDDDADALVIIQNQNNNNIPSNDRVSIQLYDDADALVIIENNNN